MGFSFYFAMMVTAALLKKTHPANYRAKLARINFPGRVAAVGAAISLPPGESAGNFLHHNGWFSEVPQEQLDSWLAEIVPTIAQSEDVAGTVNATVPEHLAGAVASDDEDDSLDLGDYGKPEDVI